MDLAILYWIQDVFGGPFMDAVMPLVTALGNKCALWIAIGGALYFPKDTRRWGITLLVVLIASQMLSEWAIKPLIGRPRPFALDPSFTLLIDPPGGASFPSSHALAAFCCTTVLTFAPIPKQWKGVAWVVAVLIAFSRLYLFVHNPSDVLAGALLGVALGLIGVWVNNTIAKRAKRKQVDGY